MKKKMFKLKNLYGKTIFKAKAVSEKSFFKMVSEDRGRINFRYADMRGKNIMGLDFSDVNFSYADFTGTFLNEVNFGNATFYKANLFTAYGIAAALYLSSYFCAVFTGGEYNRTCMATWNGAEIGFRLGCFRGTKKEAIRAIRNKYGKGTQYEKSVKNAYNQLRGKI